MMQQMLVGLGGAGASIPDSVSYFAIGGGGSASPSPYGAGGSAQVAYESTFAPSSGTVYTITIGGGGYGGSSSPGNDGTNSQISSVVTATGGLCPNEQSQPGQTGRMGPGNNSYSGGYYNSAGGGGGAGAGGPGTQGNRFGTVKFWKGGDGGPGVTLSIHPTTSLRVGGGGGGGGLSAGSSQRSGVSQDGGGQGHAAPNNGVANTGGGGGSAGGSSGFAYNGGSGRVVLRYADSFDAATATTGNPTVTVSGGYRPYDFTSSGSITF